MIIFLSDHYLIPYIDGFIDGEVKVYNFSSPSSVAKENVHSLITVGHLFDRSVQINHSLVMDYVNSVEFDIKYAQAILEFDTKMFEDFMKIINDNHEGKIVILLVYREPYRDSIMESLIKLIQQRYGYNSWIVDSIEDIYSCKESTYTPEGLLTIEEDIKKYKSMFPTDTTSKE